MISLVQHVLYHAPEAVRGAERLLLIAIAEETRVKGKAGTFRSLTWRRPLACPSGRFGKLPTG
ncbi:hypothetical protein GCM10027614_78730 [Micromonospora vulcania]